MACWAPTKRDFSYGLSRLILRYGISRNTLFRREFIGGSFLDPNMPDEALELYERRMLPYIRGHGMYMRLRKELLMRLDRVRDERQGPHRFH